MSKKKRIIQMIMICAIVFLVVGNNANAHSDEPYKPNDYEFYPD